MDQFSFTISPFLRTQLESIDSVKNGILLTTLTPRDEIKLRWEASINRISYSLRLKSLSMKKAHIVTVLTPFGRKRLSNLDQMVLNYKKAYDYIYQEWSGSSQVVTADTISELYMILYQQKLLFDAQKVTASLQFIQVNPEHPVIQAALTQIMILSQIPLTAEVEHVSRMISYLFLSKKGYDLRGLLVLEDYFFHHMASYQEAIHNNISSSNVSGYLEYFTDIVRIQTSLVLEKVLKKDNELGYPDSYFTLTERQKGILALFDEPGVRITNRAVQQVFHVSQITSSRDLAKIASLGLVFPNGKGRSIYYTKV